jgi:D-tyrosyl-tRNA(Tyr) deacylase
MRAVLQRVSEASVTVDGEVVGRIGRGLMALIGVHKDDTDADLEWMVQKVPQLRIFDDDEGKMNRSLVDVSGALLLVSQFTLYADARKGRRPSYTDAMPPEAASALIDRLVERFRTTGLEVQTGRFRATMRVALVNEGPVTILLDSRREDA